MFIMQNPLLEVSEGILVDRERFAADLWYVPVYVCGRSPAHISGDLGSNPGHIANFSLNILMKDRLGDSCFGHMFYMCINNICY